MARKVARTRKALKKDVAYCDAGNYKYLSTGGMDKIPLRI